MSHQLNYDLLHHYDAGQVGITIPVVLQLSEQEIKFDAKLDTGASYCIFERHLGEMLGLNIESGYPKRIGTATGAFLTFGHEVTMLIEGFQFDVTAYFAQDYAINRSVLGRHGFLNLVQLGLIDYEGKLFLSRYSD